MPGPCVGPVLSNVSAILPSYHEAQQTLSSLLAFRHSQALRTTEAYARRPIAMSRRRESRPPSGQDALTAFMSRSMRLAVTAYGQGVLPEHLLISAASSNLATVDHGRVTSSTAQ